MMGVWNQKYLQEMSGENNNYKRFHLIKRFPRFKQARSFCTPKVKNQCVDLLELKFTIAAIMAGN